jgi:hypothetical protein
LAVESLKKLLQTKIHWETRKCIVTGQKMYSQSAIPRVSPCISMEPLDGSKKTSRDDEAESSKREANAGGRSELPRAI